MSQANSRTIAQALDALNAGSTGPLRRLLDEDAKLIDPHGQVLKSKWIIAHFLRRLCDMSVTLTCTVEAAPFSNDEFFIDGKLAVGTLGYAERVFMKLRIHDGLIVQAQRFHGSASEASLAMAVVPELTSHRDTVHNPIVALLQNADV